MRAPVLPPVKTDPGADVGVEQRTSRWQIVAAQLRKNRAAMFARALVVGLFALAVVAPLVAFNVPILHVDGASVRLPLLSSLFDRSLFESGVDVFFNLLLLALPVWLLVPKTAAWLGGRRGEAPWRTLVRGALLVLVLAVEGWAAVNGRTALKVAVFGMVLVGTIVLGGAAASGASRMATVRARLACVGLFLATLVVLFSLSPEESPYRVWRGPRAQVSGLTVFPPIPFHPTGVADTETLQRARQGPSAENWLGCDINGRDVTTRIVFGLRISLTIGIVAVAIYVLIGTVLGSLAGYYGGKVDLIISRLIEVMICFPTLFLLLTIIAVFETRSIFLIMGAIGVVAWPGVARLVRGEFLRQRKLDYVTAAVAQGLPERRVIFRHVLPNCLGPVLVSATFGVASSILTESGIAFLGLGDQTAVSWGQMLTTGRSSQQWHLILVPGFAIFFVVTVFNLLGEGLRDALDPKLRR